MRRYCELLAVFSVVLGMFLAIAVSVAPNAANGRIESGGAAEWPAVEKYLRRGESWLPSPVDTTHRYELLMASEVVPLDDGCRIVRIRCRHVFDETEFRPAQHRDIDAIYVLAEQTVRSMHYCGYNGGIRDDMAFAAIFPR